MNNIKKTESLASIKPGGRTDGQMPQLQHSQEHKLYLTRVKRRKQAILAMQIGLFILLLVLWELVAYFNIIDSFITSSPSRIYYTLIEMFSARAIWTDIGLTLFETVISFALSTLIGTLIALLLWYCDTVKAVLDPYLVVINSLPKIALGPIILIWFGIGLQSIVAMSILISVVITIISMLSAFLQSDKGKLLLLSSMGASRTQLLTKLVLPSSMPAFVSVLKINVGMAWVGTIMGEYLVSSAGLGYLIQYGGQVFNLDLVMSCIVLLCILATGMYLLVALTEKLFLRWQ